MEKHCDDRRGHQLSPVHLSRGEPQTPQGVCRRDSATAKPRAFAVCWIIHFRSEADRTVFIQPPFIKPTGRKRHLFNCSLSDPNTGQQSLLIIVTDVLRLHREDTVSSKEFSTGISGPRHKVDLSMQDCGTAPTTSVHIQQDFLHLRDHHMAQPQWPCSCIWFAMTVCQQYRSPWLPSILQVQGCASRLSGPLGWRVTAGSAPPSQYIGAFLAAMGLSQPTNLHCCLTSRVTQRSPDPGCHGPHSLRSRR